jgi:hypothetical protein
VLLPRPVAPATGPDSAARSRCTPTSRSCANCYTPSTKCSRPTPTSWPRKSMS